MKFKDTEFGDLTGKTYKGNIHVYGRDLTSLEGAPKKVIGDFLCHMNDLTSLKDAPEEVTKNFNAHSNFLTSLEFSPKKVGGDFKVMHNKLTTIDYAPKKVMGWFECSYNDINTLKGFSTEGCVNFEGAENPNPHLKEEWEVRSKNPTMTEEEIIEEMYKLTSNETYLSDEIKDIFLF